MELRAHELVAMLILPLIHITRTAERILSCDVNSLEPCGASDQVCNATTLSCQCLPGLVMVEGLCAQPAAGSGSGAGLAAGAALLLAAALLCAAVVLVARRYGLLQWVRHRLTRPSSSAAYEDVMIGADDPPLSL